MKLYNGVQGYEIPANTEMLDLISSAKMPTANVLVCSLRVTTKEVVRRKTSCSHVSLRQTSAQEETH